MSIFRSKYIFILYSVLVAFIMAVAQVLANTILLYVATACFGALVLWAALNDMVVPVMLFMLPWAPLLKLRPGAISFYTIALLGVMAVFVLKSSRKINVYYLLPAILLAGLTLCVKAFNHYSIDNDYIFFFACLILFPLISAEMGKQYDFYALTIFFSVGIVLAALSSQQLLIFPTISRYITVHSYDNITRLAGYYGDPNFYSVHITAAMAGVIVLLSNETKRFRRWFLYALALLLLYSGFLAVAKSFALISICLLLLWIIDIFFQKGKLSIKLMLLLAIGVGALFIVSSTLFTDLTDMLLYRFVSSSGNISDLTTGRTDLWLSYLNAMEHNPILLVFGEGCTDILINGRASHNTVLQIVYQVGLIGAVLLLIWGVLWFKLMLKSVRINTAIFLQVCILLMGAIGPWIALDMLFFYEFYLLPFYVCWGVQYLARFKPSEISEDEE